MRTCVCECVCVHVCVSVCAYMCVCVCVKFSFLFKGDTVGKLSGGGQRSSKKSNGSTVPTCMSNGNAPFSPHKSGTFTGVTQNNNAFKVTVVSAAVHFQF